MKRRSFCFSLLASPAIGAPPAGVKLIAHRGGVVDERYAENSKGSVEAAIARGYWMLEVDVRESKDGRLVVQHDPDFQRFFGDSRQVADMDWTEIARLRAKPGNTRPMEFQELAALCRNRVRLMVDTKEPEHSEQFFAEMERALRKNDLLASAMFIGTDQSRERFHGKAIVGVTREQLQAFLAKGEKTKGLYFLFEHGRTLDEAGLRLAAKAGVPAVVSINIFHYEGMDHWKAARADVERLRRLGMTYFQIDSIYDRWLTS